MFKKYYFLHQRYSKWEYGRNILGQKVLNECENHELASNYNKNISKLDLKNFRIIFQLRRKNEAFMKCDLVFW
jgi:hypothetical protein